MKTAIIVSALALGLAAPAVAQEEAQPAPAAEAEAPAAQAAATKAGDTIYDTAGEVVGTVESVTAENFVLSTGTNKATLPLSSLGTGAKGPTISLSRAQLEAEIEKAKAN